MNGCDGIPEIDSGEPRSSVDPLHGVTLKMILERLVDLYGWEELGRRIDIRCFTHAPSVSSSLKFLRKTPWARDKVESLYLVTLLRQNNSVGCSHE